MSDSYTLNHTNNHLNNNNNNGSSDNGSFNNHTRSDRGAEVVHNLEDTGSRSSASTLSLSVGSFEQLDVVSDHSRKVDPYGFERDHDFNYNDYEQFMSDYLSILARRASRWSKSYGYDTKKAVSKSRKLKRYCRKGIPGDFRPDVWFHASRASQRKSTDPNQYNSLRSLPPDHAVTETILLDIHRTFPENVYFSELVHQPNSLCKPLQNVLEAISRSNPHIGYCQGMNFVAGLLLLIVKNEEKAFWLMDTLIQNIIPDYYDPQMIAVRAEQELLGEIVKWKIPDLYKHLEELGVEWGLVGMKWFISLYADVMPVETVLRIWDCLFLEGSKILLRVALTLVTLNKDKLMKCTNFPQAVDLFRDMVKDPATLNCHTFMQSIFKVTGSMPSARINSMRDKCVQKIKKSH